jgi:tRNA-splicing ligase RtcB
MAPRSFASTPSAFTVTTLSVCVTLGSDDRPVTFRVRTPWALRLNVHQDRRIRRRLAQAAGKKKGWGAKARIISPGRVTQEMMTEWVDRKGVILRGGGLDESPHVYRRLPDVLASQGGTVEVLRTLRPLIVVMAGAGEFDPYKD